MYCDKRGKFWELCECDEKTMTEHEKNAREVLTGAIKMNVGVRLALDLLVHLGNEEPVLTDKECRSIAVNYPYPSADIRQWFKRPADAD